MKKKVLSLALSAAMALTLTVPVSAASVSSFKDVSTDSWYYDSVKYVAEKDYMNGTSATTFDPSDNMTRAMFATVISRVAGVTVDNSATTEFTDVASGMWYTGAVKWGVENDLLEGYGNGRFGTDDAITRQDIAVLTERFLTWYCEQNNKDIQEDALVESFTDVNSIAAYAKDSVEFCRKAGLLTGYEDGSFGPLGLTTRAEIAAIIERIEFVMDSAAPAVVYTGTDGKTATLAVKAGDVITVDPNGGSVTYDGKAYKDSFTITVTEDGVALPDATRSSYKFGGWKVTTDANGAYTFTAQWTRISSGGGGGDSYVKGYTVEVDLAKTGTSYDMPLSAGKYSVTFNNGNITGGDVALTKVAKDLLDEAAFTKIVNKNLTINGEKAKEGSKIFAITVEEVGVTNIIDADYLAEIINDSEIGADDVRGVLEALDNGVTSKEELIEKVGEKNADIVEDIITQLDTELRDESAFVEKVKNQLGDSADKILSNLGLKDEDIITIAKDYYYTLNGIFNPEAKVTTLAGDESNTSVSTAGGIKIKANPMEVLINQYKETTKETVEKKLISIGIETEGDRDAIVDELFKTNGLYNLCNPENFASLIPGEGEEAVYELKDAATCAGNVAKIIDAAENSRLSLVEKGVITEDKAETLFDKVIANVDESISPDQLNKITSHKAKIVELMAKNTTPMLVGDILAGRENEGLEEDVIITLNSDQIANYIDRIFGELDMDDYESEDNNLIKNLIDKLVGDYTISVKVTVE